MLWMSRKFIIISKICVLLVRIVSKWTFRQVSWKVQEHLWSKKIYQISNSQQTCQYINQLHSELQCVSCEQSHELCTHILEGCFTLDWVSEATLKPVGTYYNKTALERRKTLGHLRSINRNMIIHFANQSQTCELLKKKKFGHFMKRTCEKWCTQSQIELIEKIHIDYHIIYMCVCRVLGITV